MTTPTLKLKPSEPLEKYDGEQRLEKKSVNSLNIHNSRLKEMITYLKDKNSKSKNKV